MSTFKNPFRVVGNEVQELIGEKYVTVANCIVPPKVTNFVSDGVLYTGKIAPGHLNLFYCDNSRQRTVKALDVKKVCPDGVGEICIIDQNGERKRFVKLTCEEVGADVENEFFPRT